MVVSMRQAKSTSHVLALASLCVQAYKPDISTPDAFRPAPRLNAKSIAYVRRGASGQHFIAVCERLGIAETEAKGEEPLLVLVVAEFVAKGEAELAIQQMSELVSIRGTDLVGASS